MRWTWDDEKNRTNTRDHGLSFETAQLVFRDPLAAARIASELADLRGISPAKDGAIRKTRLRVA